MSKKNISPSQTLKIDEIFNQKGWKTDNSIQLFLYNNYIQRFSVLPDDDAKDLFFELTHRFENIFSISQIMSLFRKGYNKLNKTKVNNAHKIYFLPLIVPKLGYENKSKYPILNKISKILGFNRKVYIERPQIKSCDNMIYFLKMEYRDMYGASKFVFPKTYSDFKKQFDKKNDMIILIDDFIGTGNTADEVLNFFVNKEKLNSNNNICILTLIAQNRGISFLQEKYNVEVLTSLIQDMSITDYYGIEAQSKKEIIERMSKSLKIKKDIFGYENSEALVCILNKSPNNTLPIFWHETKANPAPFPRMKINMNVYE